jgi:hypothetical protein
MSADTPSPREELQFDRVETSSPASGATAESAGPFVICEMCSKPVGDEYHHVNERPVCASCRDVLVESVKTPRSAGPLVKAGVFGLGAAIAGAAVYYAVVAITNYQIGLVAIAIGYMVGYAVRKGAGGRGGRRFQVLALMLTYWSVGLAYTSLGFEQLTRGEQSALLAITLFVYSLTLPVISVISSFPGGLLSALIIGIGLYQAWSMTGRHKLAVSGPYKVGPGSGQ